MRQLQETWHQRVGSPRRDSAVSRLIRALPAANHAVNRLVDAGVLIQVSVGRRNRAFEAPELIDLFTAVGQPNGRHIGL